MRIARHRKSTCCCGPASSLRPGPRERLSQGELLRVDIIDRATNKEVWSGTVVQKLDAQKVDQSLQKVGAAIDKLLAEYPA